MNSSEAEGFPPEELDLGLPPRQEAAPGMTIGQLVAELDRLHSGKAVLLGNAPGPLAHLTETDTSVILDKCTQGTCCAARDSESQPAPPLPDGAFGRIELPGYRNHTGWVTEETRFGTQMAVVRNWDGQVIAEVVFGPGSQFVHMPTPLKRPEPQQAITASPWYDDDQEPF